MFKEIGKAIGEKVVNDMIASGRFNRMIDDTVAKEYEKMATEPKYALQKEKLLAVAKSIREKQKVYREKREQAWKNLPFYSRWFGDFEDFCK